MPVRPDVTDKSGSDFLHLLRRTPRSPKPSTEAKAALATGDVERRTESQMTMQASPAAPPVLTLDGIGKSFGAVRALDGVDLTVRTRIGALHPR